LQQFSVRIHNVVYFTAPIIEEFEYLQNAETATPLEWIAQHKITVLLKESQK